MMAATIDENTMQTGKTLEELAREITRQAEAKRDFVAPTTALAVRAHGEVGGIGEAQARHTVTLKTAGDGPDEVFGMGDTFHAQMAGRLGIPKAYYDRMRTEAPELLASNANHWLQANPQQRLVRTMDGTARALLSDRYRPLDHGDLLNAVLPALNAVGGITIKSCQVTDRRLYVQAVTDRLRGEVKVGDEVQAGIVISNSEIGEGSLRIEHLVYRLVCLNGMIVGDALRKTHIGRSNRNGFDVDAAREFFTDRTRELDDAAFFSKVRDTVAHTLSEGNWNDQLGKLRGATERRITGDPTKAIEALAKPLNLTELERGGVLRHLVEGGDLSAYGVANAVTALAHDVDSYDRSVELERAGSQVIELPRTDWERIANAA